MPPSLTLRIVRFVSRIKWSNPGNGVAPFLTPWFSRYRKGRLLFSLNFCRQFYLFYIYLPYRFTADNVNFSVDEVKIVFRVLLLGEGHSREVKRTKLHSVFELETPILFPEIIPVSLSACFNWNMGSTNTFHLLKGNYYVSYLLFIFWIGRRLFQIFFDLNEQPGLFLGLPPWPPILTL